MLVTLTLINWLLEPQFFNGAGAAKITNKCSVVGPDGTNSVAPATGDQLFVKLLPVQCCQIGLCL